MKGKTENILEFPKIVRNIISSCSKNFMKKGYINMTVPENKVLFSASSNSCLRASCDFYYLCFLNFLGCLLDI